MFENCIYILQDSCNVKNSKKKIKKIVIYLIVTSINQYVIKHKYFTNY